MIDAKTSEEIIEFTRELVRMPSLSGREREPAMAVERKMRELGYNGVRTDECGSVVGLVRSTVPGPTIMFDSHMDTVEITNREAWSHDPLGGQLDDGRIWGRGATDMKGAVAATVVGLGRLPRDGSAFRGTIVVSASVAEEMIEGAALERIIKIETPDFVVICEPTECQLGIGQKGRAGIWVTTKGKAAHTANPGLGDNAVYKMVGVIDCLRSIRLPKDALLGDGIMELVEIQSFPFPGKSIVPDGCRARLDRRLTRAETMESVLESIRDALQGLRDWDVEFTTAHVDCYTGEILEMADFHPGWALDQTSLWLGKAKAGLEASGIEPRFYSVPYCTNGSFTAVTAKIPTMIFGPSSIRLAHAVDEYIKVEELKRGARGFAGLAKALSQ